jgi:hypothetical protein
MDCIGGVHEFPIRVVERHADLSAPGPLSRPRLHAMSETLCIRRSALEHLRIARLLDAHGHVIGAICAYGEAMREQPEAAAEARVRIAALARRV